MQKAILLDRNAVSLIKSFVKTGNPRDRDKRIFLNRLRRYDRSWNFVSPILAINEGQRGTQETSLEFIDTAMEESDAIRKFYRAARTDSEFFHETDQLRELTNGFRETNFDRYVEFLERVSPEVIQPTAVEKRKAKRDTILRVADELRVSRGHVILVCVLSALYGNSVATRILNPRIKGRKAYNATCDLMVVSRVGQFEAINIPKLIDFEFVTNDKDLKSFLKLVSNAQGKMVSHDTATNTVGYAVSYSVSAMLFPEISDADFDELKLCLLQDDVPL